MPQLIGTVRSALPRTRIDERVRRTADACRNVRISPAQARRQLAAQLVRQQLERPPSGIDGGGEHRTDRTADGVADAGVADDGVADTLRRVTAALEQAAIPYLVVPPDPDRPCRVAVPRRFQRRSRQALRGFDHEAGAPSCEVEYWPLEPALTDRLWQWRWEAADHLLGGDPATVDELDIGDRRYPTARGVAAQPKVDQVTFPIDIVYTWVDSTDPDWLAGKRTVAHEIDPHVHSGDADDPSRYHSHDELRYSLRSVAMFADFVRHVFVVTDGQVPSWLDTEHPRLTVVDHSEIFADDRCLPTFNSHAIESRLHHIAGLAEHYLYLNDDFFFGRPVPPEGFFHANGTTKLFLSGAKIPAAGASGAARSVDAAAQNTRRLIHQRFGRLASNKLKHTPYAQRRSVLFEMEQVLREDFARTAASRIRSTEDVPVPSSLFHYYAYLTGRAVPGRITSRYVSLGEAGLARRLRGLGRRRDFDVLCVNDSVDAHTNDLERRSRLLERFMASYWPTKSPFER